MWSQYDENLCSNQFFKEIKENHGDIIDESSVQGWVICVPRVGTIKSSEISSDIILDHILVSLEDTKEHYFTLSKKQVVVRDKQLVTDVDNSNTSVDILFEETFYTNGSSKFLVWCIDRPLFLKYKFCDSHSTKHLSNLHDCIDFLWCESLGHNVLDSIKNLVCTFQTNYDLEIESLQTQREVIGCLFSQCLQICFKNDILKEKCMLNSQFLDKLKLAVETYMQYCLGRKLMFSINTVNYQKDGCLNKSIRNSSDIQYQHLGIDSYFSDVILSAKSQLNQINSYWTVLDKTECLKKTLDIIFESGKDLKNCITSDDVLQILVFVILKLNINNWFSNLTYMNEFQLSVEKSNPTTFCISTLEAAIEFISSSTFWDIKNNLHEYLKSAKIAVDFLEKKLKSGKMKALSNLPLATHNEMLQDMCHPLCACLACENILEQSSDSFFDKVFPFGEISENFLIFSTCQGKCEVVEYLLNRGVDINFSDCFGKTSLHHAASRGLQSMLLLLINRKANVNMTDNEKNTPLHLASLNGHENCIKALLYSSPEVELNIGNSFGDTPLILASRWGYFEIVKILLENGASIIVKNKRNQTVFDVSPNFYITRLCDKFSARQNIKCDKIIELSNISGVVNSRDTCKNHGIRPKSTDQFKKIDLLLKSIENNDFPLTCFYLGYSNNTLITEGGNCHPLCLCDKCKYEQRDDYREENTQTPINVNMCDANGYTALHTAAKFGRTEILRLLLDNGSLPNIKTFKTLYTPLHLACIEERIQTVRELVKCGDCKVDEQDAKGNTPLYYACAKGSVKIVEILLANGADCNKKNLSNRSALMQSEENMQYGIFRILKNNVLSNLDKDAQVSSSNSLF